MGWDLGAGSKSPECMSQLAPSCLVQGPWPFLGHRGFPDNTILENNFLFHDQLRWRMTPKTRKGKE